MSKPAARLLAEPTVMTPPDLPPAGQEAFWDGLHGSAAALAIARLAARSRALLVLATLDASNAQRLLDELRFYGGDALTLVQLPDWETLPYDPFSPYQDIVSERLATLYRLPGMQRGVLIVPVGTLLQRLAPVPYVQAHSLLLQRGDTLDVGALRLRLQAGGYRCVAQVMEHGEFAVRGSLIDLFPMGTESPIRIDLLDDEVDSIRVFEPDTQRTVAQMNEIRLLPAREFPLTDEGIARFRQNYRASFEGEPARSQIYREVSANRAPPGIEYYLPLFFEQTATLFDYLPAQAALIYDARLAQAAQAVYAEIEARYEQRRHDTERPLLPPERIALPPAELHECLARYARVRLLPEDGAANESASSDHRAEAASAVHFPSAPPPALPLHAHDAVGASPLLDWLRAHGGPALFAADSLGRREQLLAVLAAQGIKPKPYAGFAEFAAAGFAGQRLGITVASLERGLWLTEPPLAVIAEPQLFGERALQRRRRRRSERAAENLIRDLSELSSGAPVVHEEHGVGRYLGLQRLTVGGQDGEFLQIEYAGGDQLYVPVLSLQLVSRYSGAGAETAPLHRLGTEQWARARRKAAERARDVAAELLDIYARRAARQGLSLRAAPTEYAEFVEGFPFEETADQQAAIEATLRDLAAGQPMDRVVCGDVGFGKTEVALRAAFVAVQDGRQVAVLVPTTLLAQQHYQNFSDRFASCPVRVESLSRFTGKKDQAAVLRALEQGDIDIVVGTHRLLQPDVHFKNLGLVILDEEHRFGVRHKERLKSLRAEVHVLTLTATPIPRTLNMALAGLRELSIIATPPENRHAIKTFVGEYDRALIRDACLRELARGGQIYYLHNDVATIEKTAGELRRLLPQAEVRVAHGQMRASELERVMLDFYHRRFGILVCTTIIESGIDVPNANTIVIERADKLGLAQLHQLRGRVGRSHHRAYAYLIVPPRTAMTADAIKRLEALESAEELGAGFTLATHDLEIRGAGELLGEEQSGQIQEVGFTMYNELLERAVQALKRGETPSLDEPLTRGPEIELRVAALIPEDYLPDVHARLLLYKRIAAAADAAALDELQVEMIDRFGLLPETTKRLFAVTALKLAADALGIERLEAGPAGARIRFRAQPRIDVQKLTQLLQREPKRYRMDGPRQLKVQFDGTDPAQRMAAVRDLLQRLAPA